MKKKELENKILKGKENDIVETKDKPLFLKYKEKKDKEKLKKENMESRTEQAIFYKFLNKQENKLIDEDNKKNEQKNENKPAPPIKKTKIQRNQNNKSIHNLGTSSESDKSIKSFNHSLNMNKEKNDLEDIESRNKKNEKKMKIDTRVMKYNIYELNTLRYEEALNIDNRNYIEYYFSLLKTRHLLMFSFYPINDYNSRIIKMDLFFLYFTISYSVNALFFNDKTMHQIYEDEGKYNFIYQIPQIIYSSIISSFLNYILKILSLSEKNVLQVKQEINIAYIDKKAVEVVKCLKYKYTLYYLISTPFSIFCWYYIGCFCAVFKNTQIHLIKDSLISLGISCLYPLFLYLLPGIFRIPSLRSEKKDKECLYKFSKIIQMI